MGAASVKACNRMRYRRGFVVRGYLRCEDPNGARHRSESRHKSMSSCNVHLHAVFSVLCRLEVCRDTRRTTQTQIRRRPGDTDRGVAVYLSFSAPTSIPHFV